MSPQAWQASEAKWKRLRGPSLAAVEVAMRRVKLAARGAPLPPAEGDTVEGAATSGQPPSPPPDDFRFRAYAVLYAAYYILRNRIGQPSLFPSRRPGGGTGERSVRVLEATRTHRQLRGRPAPLRARHPK
eukprot:4366639-Pyramimonas_sp.AAC.1